MGALSFWAIPVYNVSIVVMVRMAQPDQLQTLLQYFLDSFPRELLSRKRAPADRREQLILEYFERLSDMSALFAKLDKYDVFFRQFYPVDTSLISREDAIEHHFHAYMQDLYILKERLARLIDSLKKDVQDDRLLSGISDDESRVAKKQALDDLKEHMETSMNTVINARARHVHDLSHSIESIQRAKALRGILRRRNGSGEQQTVTKLNNQYRRAVRTAERECVKIVQRNKKPAARIKSLFAERFGTVFRSLTDPAFNTPDTRDDTNTQGQA